MSSPLYELDPPVDSEILLSQNLWVGPFPEQVLVLQGGLFGLREPHLHLALGTTSPLAWPIELEAQDTTLYGMVSVAPTMI